MKGLGQVTTALLILGMVAAVVLGVRSLPDVRRYAQIRRM